MKPHGSKFEYEQERNDDLMKAYHSVIDASCVINLPEVYRNVVKMPSKRFWVSEERAAIVISSMMKGDKLEKMREKKREMFQEIYARAMKIRRAFPEKSIFDIAIMVVRQPAPEFYMTPGYAKLIILSAKRQWYEERRRKLRHLFL